MENERYKKLVLLHSNDMHGDFLAENLDNKLVGGVSMLSGYISKVKKEEENVLYCVAGTFLVLASLPIQLLVQFGIVTAVGVLLDTFVVRPLLVPALLTVFGKWSYWPNKKLK